MDGRRFDADARRRARGARLLGVDEAGRGPLAGPVVVAAVALPEEPSPELGQARDSKVMSPQRRRRLFEVIHSEALAVSLAWAHPGRIDGGDILKATLEAMGRAARRAARRAGGGAFLVLVDGPWRIPNFKGAQEAVVGGDARSLSIAAASIVAKVERDRWMACHERRYPGYGFAKHKGYGTREHLDALDRLGPCAAHRRTYAPVACRSAGSAR